jgi:hypothetical protein
MRLGVNFYQNKYLVKLAKLDGGMEGSIIATYRKTPSLVIYQSFTIANGKGNMGVVSELSPRIINAFI